ncbi:MAG: hypothetical protein AABY83_09290 [Pseudomonadota bacterium]
MGIDTLRSKLDVRYFARPQGEGRNGLSQPTLNGFKLVWSG